ncbi:MAG: hypothetical protein ACI4KG_02505, partial [Oscillospiraceae bacterium]
MKKKISLILAFLMAASMLAGCKKTDEESAGLPEAGTPSETVSLTQMTTEATEETTVPEVTEMAETEETSETEETTVSETEESTTAASSETSATETTTVTTAEKSWSETEISETLYIKTSCYSRKAAIVGSESVKKYEAGTKINIVAATDTGYYKLADGTFIHSDYVTDEKPDQSAETTAASKNQESDPDDEKTTSSKPISSSYKKSYTDRYPYQQLTKDEQKLYADIVNAAENFETKVKVPSGFSSNDVFKIYCLVFNQEPQLFWLSPSVPVALGGTLDLEFDISRSEAEAIQAEIDANVKDIMAKVGGYSSTVSKLKVIYDWVITHNTFSLQGT